MYLFFFKFFSHLGYFKKIDQMSLNYTVDPCWLSILYNSRVYRQAQTPFLIVRTHPTPTSIASF